MKEYRQAPGINWSKLKYMKTSPLDYFIMKDVQVEETDAMKLGSFVDCGLLTPELLEKTYIKVPGVSWGSNADKAKTVKTYEDIGIEFEMEDPTKQSKAEFCAYVENQIADSGKIPVPMESNKTDHYTYEKGMRIIEANMNKPAWKRLQESIQETQKPLYATCRYTGLELKGLLDVVTTGAIVDLKTVGILSKWVRNVKSFHYIGQLAFYQYLASLNGLNRPGSWFVFVETTSPYKMKFVEVDPRCIEAEHQKNMELLVELKTCLDNNHFPDGSDEPGVWEYHSDSEAEFRTTQYEVGQDKL